MLLNLNLSSWARRLADTLTGFKRPKKAIRKRSGAGFVEALESRELLTTFTVTTLNDTVNAGDGVTSLREALIAANANSGGDSIVFAPNINGSVLLTGGQLTISDPVTITGNGSGNTIINAQQASRVFQITNTGGNVTFNGLTITGGRTTGYGTNFAGGGINSASNGSLTIANSLVTGNSTTGNGTNSLAASGGAIFTYNFTPLTISNSSITSNSTSGTSAGGGAIYGFNGGALTITDSTISGNSTTGSNALGGGIYWFAGSIAMDNVQMRYNSTQGTGAQGGAIFTNTAPVTLTNGTVLLSNATTGNNSDGGAIRAQNAAVNVTNGYVGYNSTAGANSSGGAISSPSQPVTITNSSVYFNSTAGNSTSGLGSSGGAIATNSGNVTLLNSTVRGNAATGSSSAGGGIFSSNGAVSVTSSTISGNSTTGSNGWGGGVRAAYGSLTVVNSTISGNFSTATSAAGGGLSVNSAPMTLINSTVTQNSSAGTNYLGGGLFAFTGNVTLQNSIVAQNSNNGAPDLSPGAGTLAVNNTLIGNNLGTGLTASASPNAQGNLIGSNAAPINPVLGPLQNNGGPTFTHALLNSPAINRGSNAFATSAGLTLDQAGQPRFDGSSVDMGAFELQTPSATFAVATSSVNELGNPTVQVTVNLSAASALPVTIPFSIGGTASNPSDYTIAASPLVIPAGQTSGTIQVNVVDVIGFEPSETVILTFGTLTNATPGAITSTTLTILDFDSAPTVSFAAATQSVSEGVGIVAVTVNLQFAVAQNVTIPFVVGGTATNPADFTVTSSPLVIPAGQTSGTINVTVVNDTSIESDETVTLTLGTPTNAILGTTTVNTLTINDNDLAPTASFSIGSQTQNEGAGNVTLTVNLSSVAASAVTIPFTVTGTATTGADFSISASPLVIAAGATSGTITLNLVNDTAIEGNETVIVTLNTPTNATLGATTVQTVTIADNDNNATPTIAAGQTFTIAENSNGGTPVGTVIASDTDTVAPFNTLTFSLNSNPNNAFAINPVNGQITVANQAALNFESSSALAVGVTVTDGGNLAASQTVTVNLTNVNEAPAINGGQSFSVAENSSVGTVVGTVAATDPDTAPPFGTRLFTLNSNPNNAFAINASTGQITVANTAALNFEVANQIVIGVTLTDGGSPALTATQSVIVNITNVAEAPVLTGGSGTATFVRNRGAINLMPNLVVNASEGSTSLGRLEISFFIPKRGLLTDISFGSASSLGTVVEGGPTDFRQSGGTRTLSITLNAGTTAAEVQAFLRSFTFNTRKLDPTRGALGRKIEVRVFDRSTPEVASNLVSTSIRANRK